MSKTEFQAVCSGARYVPDSVVEKNVPFNRVASKKCLKWYTLRTNATRDERNLVLEGDNRCAECNQMYPRARSTSKRNLDITLKERLQRTRPSSNYPIHLLSPRSKDIRLQNLQKKTRKQEKQSAQLRRYEKQMEAMSLDLSDQQSQELLEFVQAIPQKALEQVYVQATKEAGDDMSGAIQKSFENDQRKKFYSV